jgi:hypothetical protein
VVHIAVVQTFLSALSAAFGRQECLHHMKLYYYPKTISLAAFVRAEYNSHLRGIALSFAEGGL